MHRPIRQRPARPIVDFKAAIEENDVPKADYLHIDAFVAQAIAFRRRLQEYVVFGKEDIQKQEDDYEKEVKAHEVRRDEYEALYAEANSDLNQMIETLNQERAEEEQLQREVSELRERRAGARQAALGVTSDVNDVQGANERLRQKHEAELKAIQSRKAKIEPELRIVESLLSCSIDNVQRDTVLLRFTNVDEANLAREFSLVLDLSQQKFKVPTSTPLLPSISELVEMLNGSRDFPSFVKKVRLAFREYTREERGGGRG
ncbi:uncharacterized protein EI90DRAFT_3060439 [Cantharellus anzutake]|uniref:uncharacterized protein n=1 Tax=Cantharellus anzutake TaxID=1750568 RepID=UPI00190869A2|nr:uncharacterized protein EI90DRAFT_3060439 [Cantharellus anzutake]KAF8330353.1 hypothetical protein EI90DRAFT_3060439 [Cantharellus anzutake]